MHPPVASCMRLFNYISHYFGVRLSYFACPPPKPSILLIPLHTNYSFQFITMENFKQVIQLPQPVFQIYIFIRLWQRFLVKEKNQLFFHNFKICYIIMKQAVRMDRPRRLVISWQLWVSKNYVKAKLTT